VGRRQVIWVDSNSHSRTGYGDAAVLFVGHVPTVVVAVTDPRCWDTAARVGTLELAVTARCQHTSHNTRTLNMLLNDTT